MGLKSDFLVICFKLAAKIMTKFYGTRALHYALTTQQILK